MFESIRVQNFTPIIDKYSSNNLLILFSCSNLTSTTKKQLCTTLQYLHQLNAPGQSRGRSLVFRTRRLVCMSTLAYCRPVSKRKFIRNPGRYLQTDELIRIKEEHFFMGCEKMEIEDSYRSPVCLQYPRYSFSEESQNTFM